MRSVWSFLFWLSEESFGTASFSLFGSNNGNDASMRGSRMVSLTITGDSNTCPSTPLLASTTTPASLGGVMDQIPVNEFLKAISNPLNVSAAESWLGSLLRLSMGSVIMKTGSTQESLTDVNVSRIDKVAISGTPNPHGSLLSEVDLLRNLTRHPAINKTIIAVLEGQIITVVVIVAFILVILVRDYVVQQQPEINMRAAFAAEGDRQNEEPAHGRDQVELRDQDSGGDDDHADEDHDDGESEGEEETDSSGDEQPSPLPGRAEATADERGRRLAATEQRQRPIAGFRRRATRQNMPDRRPDGPAQLDPTQPAPPPGTEDVRRSTPGPSDSQQEHATPNELDDEYVTALMKDAPADGTSAVTQYMRIYREAEGDRDRILQIISEQGLEDRLHDWVRITQSMPVQPKQPTGEPSDKSGFRSMPNNAHPNQSEISHGPHVLKTLAERSNDGSGSTWLEGGDLDREPTSTVTKGKHKAEAPLPRRENHPDNTPWRGSNALDDFSNNLTAPLGRPRAISDGPQRNETINPLANNSWSFSNLPPPNNQSGDPALRDSTTQAASTNGPLLNEPFSFNSPLGTTDQPLDRPSFGHSVPRNNAFDPHQIEVDVQTVPDFPSGIGQHDEIYQSPGSDHEDNASLEVHINAPDEVDQPGPPPRQHAQGLVDRMADFMWGDVNPGLPGEEPDEEAVDIFGDNQDAPFMDVGIEDDDNAADVEVNPEVVEAAMAAGLDPEAIEDAEDFEGIMELIGMRGPLAGLFQNAIFCAFLVSFSIFLGVFVPYNIGRITVWVVANPTRFIRIIFSSFKFAQDLALLAIGCVSTLTLDFFDMLGRVVHVNMAHQIFLAIRDVTSHIASGAFSRISNTFRSEIPLISASEMRNFSAISHEALVFVKGDISYLFSCLEKAFSCLFDGEYGNKITMARAFLASTWPAAWASLKNIPHALVHPGSWTFSVGLSEPSSTVNPGLAYWNATDRAWAVLGGYISFFVSATIYLGRGRPFSTTPTAQEWEASIIDALNQASGVMKVILIISIEMLVFPLYCGLLLDFALLPLFENTSLKSRLFFTYNFPATSIFVHWFVGTGYMFHFALFVSMCRKIMRKGVLCKCYTLQVDWCAFIN